MFTSPLIKQDLEQFQMPLNLILNVVVCCQNFVLVKLTAKNSRKSGICKSVSIRFFSKYDMQSF